MASHGTRFDEGRDVRQKYTNSEAVGTEVQGRVPAIVTTVSMETEIGSCIVPGYRASKPESPLLLKNAVSCPISFQKNPLLFN